MSVCNVCAGAAGTENMRLNAWPVIGIFLNSDILKHR